MTEYSAIPSPWGLEEDHYPYWKQAVFTYRDSIIAKNMRSEVWFLLNLDSVPEVFDIPSTIWRYCMIKRDSLYDLGAAFSESVPVKIAIVSHRLQIIIKGAIGLLFFLCCPETMLRRDPTKIQLWDLNDFMQEVWHSQSLAANIAHQTESIEEHSLRTDVNLYGFRQDLMTIQVTVQTPESLEAIPGLKKKLSLFLEEAFIMSPVADESGSTYVWRPLFVRNAGLIAQYISHAGFPQHPATPFRLESDYWLPIRREPVIETIQSIKHSVSIIDPKNVVKFREAPNVDQFIYPRFATPRRPSYLSEAMDLFEKTLGNPTEIVAWHHKTAILRVKPSSENLKPQYWLVLDAEPAGFPLSPAPWQIFLLHPEKIESILYVYANSHSILREPYIRIAVKISRILGSHTNDLREIAWLSWAAHQEIGLQSSVQVEALYNHAAIMDGHRRQPSFYTNLYQLFVRTDEQGPYHEATPAERQAFIDTKLTELATIDAMGNPIEPPREPHTPITPQKYWKYFIGRV
jgi:hypothetical protein